MCAAAYLRCRSKFMQSVSEPPRTVQFDSTSTVQYAAEIKIDKLVRPVLLYFFLFSWRILLFSPLISVMELRFVISGASSPFFI